MRKLIWSILCVGFVMSFLFTHHAVDAAEKGISIDINTASVEVLTSLPKIGPKTAEEIVWYRSEHGPFQSVDQIQKVKGIGEKKYLLLKDMITVGKGDGAHSKGTMTKKKK
ncbi:ComEA family DNA-binding protein [Thermodesulfobacteriota bacterium]